MLAHERTCSGPVFAGRGSKAYHFYTETLPIVLALALTTAAYSGFALAAGAVNVYMGAAVRPVWVASTVNVYFTVYFFGSVFPFILFLIWLWRDQSGSRSDQETPFVTIIMPAFNEEANLRRSIAAALGQDYPAYEVIVLDDGSVDHTPYLLESAHVPLIRLRSNQGKAQALNVGIRRAKGDVLVFSDADSALDPSALRRLVGRLSDPTVGAVAGQLVVVERTANLLQRWQTVEYVYGQVIVKAAQVSEGSSALICPGPVCAFRRSVLLRLGGFKRDTVVEDFDATLEVIRAGYRVVYEPAAIAQTDTPRTWTELNRQRLRWSRGNLQVLRKHRDMLFEPRYGRVGSFWLPFCLIMSFFSPLFDLVVLASLPILLVCSNSAVALIKVGSITIIMMEMVHLSQYFISMFMTHRSGRHLPEAILSIRIFNLFLSYNRAHAICAEMRRSELRW